MIKAILEIYFAGILIALIYIGFAALYSYWRDFMNYLEDKDEPWK